MEFVALGRTEVIVSRTSFGCLPIQRVSEEEASKIIRAAYDGGINFFDTARMYSDSELKLGYAFYGIRKDVVIATKTTAMNPVQVKRDLEESLMQLQTDYIDIYQLHNPSFVPHKGASDGIYDALLDLRSQGKIRHIGITNHSAKLAMEAAQSELYDTIQFPFSVLASEEDTAVVKECEKRNIGFIAMKALCGGLLTNIPVAFAFLRQFEHVVPIWGIQQLEELQQLLYFEANPPVVDDALRAEFNKERAALVGNFCRGCGYCLPCPADIPINNANRMIQLSRRSPRSVWDTAEMKEGMERIENCTHCGVCETRCPYHLKPYETLPIHLEDYRKMIQSDNTN